MNKKKILRQDSRDKHFHQFGSTTTFVPESNFRVGVETTIEKPDEVDCTAISTVKTAESKTKNLYDIPTLWDATPHTAEGADPRDTLGVAVKGLLNVRTKLVEKIWAGYYRADTGSLGSAFENIRSAMTLNQSSCTLASNFYNNWLSVGVEGVVPEGDYVVSEHDYVFLDWVVRNGVTYALVDFHLGHNVLMPAEVINVELSKTGCGAYIGSDKVGLLTQTRSLLQWLVDLYTNLITLNLKRLNTPTPPVASCPTPPLNPDVLTTWDTPANCEHNVRVLCDFNFLTPQDKDIIQACVHQESNFNNKAINHNRNWLGKIISTDWGICQINDFYHIGPGKDFPNVQYVLDNPDKAVIYMINMFKIGHLDLWVSYSSGAYRKYLKLS